MPKCLLCGKDFEIITYTHLKWKHGITCQEYRKLFPDAEFNSDNVKRLVTESVKQRHAEGKYDHIYEGNKGWFLRLPEEHQERLRRQRSDVLKTYWEQNYDEMCQTLSETAQAAWDSGEWDYLRVQIGEQSRERWEDPEFRRLQSEWSKIPWQDEGFRQRHSEAISKLLKERWENDPEYREMMTENRRQLSKEMWENPEYREMMSQLKKSHWADPEWRQVVSEKISKTVQAKCDNDPEYLKKMQENMRKARLGWKSENTSIELILYNILDELGVEYKPQVPIDHYIVDALVEGWLVLEAYGDYWHNYPDGRDQDSIRSERLQNLNFQVFPFWGHQLRDDPNGCADRITYMVDCT